jgi:FlaA1/EpsC-like NDP-sugar epimerase
MPVQKRGRQFGQVLGGGVSRIRGLVRWQRSAVQAAYDVLCWAAALWFATAIRYDLDFERINVTLLLWAVPLAAAAQLVSGPVFGLYRRRWPFGSFDEVAAVVKSTFLATGIVSVANVVVDPQLVPRSAPLGAGVTCLVLMAAGRYVWRLRDERQRRPTGDGCQRLLVFGAGEGATQVIRAMLRNPESQYLPVALLDDDPGKRNLRIMGVPVVGNRAKLAQAAEAWKPDALLIAIPSARAALVTELSELAAGLDLPVKVLPPVSELLGGKVGVADIRDVTTADLLGRHEIRTDLEEIAGYLTGKRVLVTGAGGSIGSELCRQIYRFAPAELIMLDRDESALHAVQLSIEGRALLDSPDLVLLDLRDAAATERLIAARRPQVIFHAAALKHLPLLELHPAEAVKTNVWATLDLLETAVAHGVERFVNISTDKAADPCSVLGYSKRITERLTSYMATQGSMVCLSVRFGNVLGSRGSMLTTFQVQIERGGPVTVTHPDVTRYFMTVEEAVELVIQAGAIGRGGEVLVLDMGSPVRIADVAQLLAARAERRVSIQYTGLRGGEKLHEVLLGASEADRRPSHPLISQVGCTGLEPYAVRSIDVDVPDARVRQQLADLCTLPAPVRQPEDMTGG